MAITSAAVLRAAIRMENQAILQTSVRHGISKGVLLKFRVNALADGITDNLPVKQVQDHCQVNPAETGADVRDVAAPELIHRSGIEVSLEFIFRIEAITLARLARLELLDDNRIEAILTHDATKLVLVDFDTATIQSPKKFCTAKLSFKLLKSFPNCLNKLQFPKFPFVAFIFLL